jgi:hypothetical protein
LNIEIWYWINDAELNDANAGGIDCPLLQERSDLTTYWYLMDDVSK